MNGVSLSLSSPGCRTGAACLRCGAWGCDDHSSHVPQVGEERAAARVDYLPGKDDAAAAAAAAGVVHDLFDSSGKSGALSHHRTDGHGGGKCVTYPFYSHKT